jgi:hypothetical protein
LIKWGLVAVVFGSLFGLWRWERHDRIAAEKILEAAKLARDIAAADAQRWRTASDQRDAALARLTGALAQQNDAVTKLQFSLERANGAAVQAEAESRDARTRFSERIKELEYEANAHPESVIPVGSIVRGRVDRLWD